MFVVFYCFIVAGGSRGPPRNLSQGSRVFVANLLRSPPRVFRGEGNWGPQQKIKVPPPLYCIAQMLLLFFSLEVLNDCCVISIFVREVVR